MVLVAGPRAISRAPSGTPAALRPPESHTRMPGLPIKVRFKQSEISVSVFPLWVIGFGIGFIGAIMGIGGGFLLVPALIYLMRGPTGGVIGTSMILTLVTMAGATVVDPGPHPPGGGRLALTLAVGRWVWAGARR